MPEPTADAHATTASEAAPGGRKHRRNTLNDLTGRDWIKFTKSWFICDSRRYLRNKATELHPARYPEEMVSEFIQFFTKPGEWVLDPFCGSGATLVACQETGRHGVGVELSAEYAQVARRRLLSLDCETEWHVLEGDSRDVASLLGSAGFQPAGGQPSSSAGFQPAKGQETSDSGRTGSPHYSDRMGGAAPSPRPSPSPPSSPGLAPSPGLGASPLPRQFHFIITSPPYFDMLRKSRGGVDSAARKRARAGLDTHYGDDRRDLGNITGYEEFVEALGLIFDDMHGLLRPGRYMVVVIQNLRDTDGEVRPLAWDLARRLSQRFSFQGERIWCQNSKPLGIWGYPTVFVPNVHHHYCLIFRVRPDVSAGGREHR